MRMTPQHKILADFLSVPDGTYTPMKISPGSPHQITEAQDKDGFLPLHPSFAKEDIPHFEQLKEYEGKDGTKLFSGYCDLVSDHDDIFRPNFRLAKYDAGSKDDEDFQWIYKRELGKLNSALDNEEALKKFNKQLRRNINKMVKKYESTVDEPVNTDYALLNICGHFKQWLSDNYMKEPSDVGFDQKPTSSKLPPVDPGDNYLADIRVIAESYEKFNGNLFKDMPFDSYVHCFNEGAQGDKEKRPKFNYGGKTKFSYFLRELGVTKNLVVADRFGILNHQVLKGRVIDNKKEYRIFINEVDRIIRKTIIK